MKSLAPFFVMIAILITVAVLIVALFNYWLKRQIIGSGPLNENSLKLISKLSGFFGAEALKWGIILFFGGLGLVILEFIPYSAERSSLPYGVETIFFSAGFLVYFLVSQKLKERD